MIREAIDRHLDRGQTFPFDSEPGPLPAGGGGNGNLDLADDRDLPGLLDAVNRCRSPLSEPLQERHIAGALRLMDLLADLAPDARQLLERGLRSRQPARQP